MVGKRRANHAVRRTIDPLKRSGMTFLKGCVKCNMLEFGLIRGLAVMLQSWWLPLSFRNSHGYAEGYRLLA